MAITLRTVTGSALSHLQVDTNFSDLFYSASQSGNKLQLHTTGSSAIGKSPATVQFNLGLGVDTTATGTYSHAEGGVEIYAGEDLVYTIPGGDAQGNGSHAEGGSTIASGDGAHAEGYNTEASGKYSHAEGGYIIVNSIPEVIEEYSGGIAQGYGSHAEGFVTVAIGNGSHAEGNGTTTTGWGSHAEGEATTAQGSGAHAEGQNTVASGNYSHAEGLRTVAQGHYQHVQGQYNLSSSAQSAFIHGNGTADNARSNLIFASGSQVQITGSLLVTGSTTINNILTLTPRTTTPTQATTATGSVMISGSSGANLGLYVYTGTGAIGNGWQRVSLT